MYTQGWRSIQFILSMGVLSFLFVLVSFPMQLSAQTGQVGSDGESNSPQYLAQNTAQNLSQNPSQSGGDSPTLLDTDVRTCPEYGLSLLGPSRIKQGVEQSFSIQTAIPGSEIVSVMHEVWSGGEFMEGVERSSLNYTFTDQGGYLLKSFVTTRAGCTYVTQNTVEVYGKIIIYLGDSSDEFGLIADSLDDNTILLYRIGIENEALQANENITGRLVDRIPLLNSADAIIVDSQSLGAFLGVLPEVNKLAPLNLSTIDMYAISNINNSAFRRLIATYSSLAGIQQIHVVQQDLFGSLLNALILDKEIEQLEFVKHFSTSTVDQSKVLFLSYFVDVLLIEGMPLQMVLLLLLIPLIGLVITIFRHIIGFSTYGVFKSFLVALAIYTIGLVPTLTLIGAGMLAVLSSNLLVNRVYILSAAKQALVLSLYAVLLLVLFVLETKYGIIGLEINQFSNLYGIFLVVYMLISSRSFFKESGYLFRKKWWIKMVQYASVVITILGILHRSRLHNMILGYPEVVLGIIVALFIVGRYTGLQVTEYLRFGPLISHILSSTDSEEEE